MQPKIRNATHPCGRFWNINPKKKLVDTKGKGGQHC